MLKLRRSGAGHERVNELSAEPPPANWTHSSARKGLTAVESHSEAWADSISAGIEPEIVAEAALATAFSEFLRSNGEAAALLLLDRMREKVIAGDFEQQRLRH
ncbi:MAG: hypothetical protein R3E51_08740 [Rhizobiaceae bacterium]